MRTLHAGIGPFKNEREKGDEHFAVFDENSACVAHVWTQADAEQFARAWNEHAEVGTLRAEVQRLNAELVFAKANDERRELAAEVQRLTAANAELQRLHDIEVGRRQRADAHRDEVTAERDEALLNAKAITDAEFLKRANDVLAGCDVKGSNLTPLGKMLMAAYRDRDAAQQLAQANADMLKDTLDQRDACAAEAVAMRSALDEIHRFVFRSEAEPGDYKTYLRYSGELTAAWKRIAAMVREPSPSAEWLAKRDADTRREQAETDTAGFLALLRGEEALPAPEALAQALAKRDEATRKLGESHARASVAMYLGCVHLLADPAVATDEELVAAVAEHDEATRADERKNGESRIVSVLATYGIKTHYEERGGRRALIIADADPLRERLADARAEGERDGLLNLVGGLCAGGDDVCNAHCGLSAWRGCVVIKRAAIDELRRLAAEKPAAPSEPGTLREAHAADCDVRRSLKDGESSHCTCGESLGVARMRSMESAPSDRAAPVAFDLLMNVSRGLPPSEPELREATGTVITRYADGSPAVRVTATPAASFDPTLEPSEPAPVEADVCACPVCGGLDGTHVLRDCPGRSR